MKLDPVREFTPFADLLREHRLERRTTQGALAERARMSIESVSAIERGFRRAPRRQTVALLSTALQLTGNDAERFAAAAAGVDPKPAPRRRAPPPLVASPPHLRGGVAHLIGRERDVAAVAGMVRAGKLVTICGTGGIGKTELALAVAVAQERYASGTFADTHFVSLAAMPVDGAVIETLARAFGLPAATDERELAELHISGARLNDDAAGNLVQSHSARRTLGSDAARRMTGSRSRAANGKVLMRF